MRTRRGRRGGVPVRPRPGGAADATARTANTRDQVVDFYAPREPADPAPLVILFHGGAWRAPYDRQHISPFAAHLAVHGRLAVEYRRGLRRNPAAGDGGVPEPGRPGGPAPVAHLAGRWPERSTMSRWPSTASRR